MSLATQISALATRVGQEIKAVRGEVADGLAALAAPSPPAPREVLSDSRFYSAATSFDLVTGTGTVADDVLILITGEDWGTLAGMPTPTGTAGTWTLAASADRGSNATHLKVWTRTVTVDGPQTVTVGQNPGGDAGEFFGALYVMPAGCTVEVVDAVTGASATDHSAPSVTATDASQLVISAWLNEYVSAHTYGTPPGTELTRVSEPDAGAWSTLLTATTATAAAGATGTRTVTISGGAVAYAAATVVVSGPPGGDAGALLTDGTHTGLTATYDAGAHAVDLAVLYGTTAATAAAGNDARLSDTRTPTDSSVTDAKVAAAAAIAESKLSLASDAVAGTASRRTLGTGAQQAAAGNDARLSDSRTPTAGSVVDASVSASAAIAESKLSLASDAAAGTASRRTLGTGATQAAAGSHTHAYAPTTRTISTTSPLTGGGDLSADRTLGITTGTTAGTVAAGDHTHASSTPTPQTITYAATITPSLASASTFRVTATGALAVNLPTGGSDGQLMRLWVNASGADRVVTMNASYEVSQPVPGRVFTVPSGTWGEILAENRNGTYVLLAAYPQTYTQPTPTTQSGSGAITVNCQTNSLHAITATGNISSLTVSGTATDGQRMVVEVYASSGTRTVTHGLARLNGLDTVLSVASAKIGVLGLYYSTRAGHWVLSSFNIEV